MMANNNIESSVVSSIDNNILHAKRKRMLLAEVYVHKSRKLDMDSEERENFDVFHIYELEDDESTKITPKLSTNCTDPSKIIDVLKNSTGSDTPQLQRLIEKLCAQNKKWATSRSHNKKIAQNNASNDDSTTILESTIPTPESSTIRSTSILDSNLVTNQTIHQPLAQSNSIWSNEFAQQPFVVVASTTTTTPAPQTDLTRIGPNIRVRAINSLMDINKTSAVPTNPNHIRIVNGSLPQNTPNVPMQISKTSTTNKISSIGQQVLAKQVKLWNNVIDQNNTNKQTVELRVIANSKEVDNDNTLFCFEPNEARNITNANDNSSSLKIGQVFGCVSDSFVEDLLGEKTTEIVSSANDASNQLLNELENEITDENVGDMSTTQVEVVPDNDENCFDFRCNICLKYNESFHQFKSHMLRVHHYSITCQRCHQSFLTPDSYYSHLTNKICQCPVNSTRRFICIVDPPIILMKNNRVLAFKCKHCNLSFKNQRNYVQHAQRHARLFRCKRCPKTHVWTVREMELHLALHDEEDFLNIRTVREK